MRARFGGTQRSDRHVYFVKAAWFPSSADATRSSHRGRHGWLEGMDRALHRDGRRPVGQETVVQSAGSAMRLPTRRCAS